MHTELVAIFNSQWQVIAWVAANAHELTAESVTASIPEEAEWVLGQLKERDPQLQEPLKDEHGCAIGFVSVPVGDVRYMEAVRDELKRMSLRAHVIDGSLKSDLEAMSEPDFNADLRNQVVPEVLGLPADQAKVVLEAVLKTSGQ